VADLTGSLAYLEDAYRWNQSRNRYRNRGILDQPAHTLIIQCPHQLLSLSSEYIIIKG